MCEKTDEGEAESIIFILDLSKIFSIKSFLKIWTFPFSLPKVLSLLYFAIIFNNWRKTVIKLVFLSVSTIWPVKYCQKLAIFIFLFLFHFVIIFCSLYSHPHPARPLFLIVLHNGIKKIHVRKVWSVTCIGTENWVEPFEIAAWNISLIKRNMSRYSHTSSIHLYIKIILSKLCIYKPVCFSVNQISNGIKL